MDTRNKARTFAGVFVILMGVGFLLEQFSVRWFSMGWLFSTLWPLIFIFLGVNFWGEGRKKPAMFMFFFGGMFLISTLLSWSIWGMFWPLIFIYIGVMILSGEEKGLNSAIKGESSEDELNETLVFWGMERKVMSKNFKGGDVIAIFGGGELDLREATLAKDGAELNFTCIFGGMKVMVSKDKYAVAAKGAGVMGGWVNKFDNTAKKTAKKLKIDGIAIFGGVEITN